MSIPFHCQVGYSTRCLSFPFSFSACMQFLGSSDRVLDLKAPYYTGFFPGMDRALIIQNSIMAQGGSYAETGTARGPVTSTGTIADIQWKSRRPTCATQCVNYGQNMPNGKMLTNRHRSRRPYPLLTDHTSIAPRRSTTPHRSQSNRGSRGRC